MVKHILQIIKRDLERFINLKEVDALNPLTIHFQICLYIRNKYLWEKPKTVKILNSYFHSEHIDDLSHMILNEIKKEDFF